MQIISGKTFKPFAIILGGVAGVGKTTWAAESEDPLFICGDEVSELDVQRLPQVKSWQEFKDQLEWVKTNKPKNKTLVIDTLDAMEQLLHKKILDDDPSAKGSMGKAHKGYGKAYEMAMSEMMEVRDKLIKPIRDDLGMNILLIVHSKKMKATNVKMAIEYDTNEMCLHQKVISVWKDWVSGVFFADFVTYKTEGDNTTKVFLTGDGERVLYTAQTAAHFGKNRWNLPMELPLVFSEFYKLFKAFYKADAEPEQIVSLIKELSNTIQEESTKLKVLEQVEASKTDTRKLNRILTRVQELTNN